MKLLEGLSFPCKHYLWILDSIQFIDGCKVFQDNEEEKYSQFFEVNSVLFCLTSMRICYCTKLEYKF